MTVSAKRKKKQVDKPEAKIKKDSLPPVKKHGPVASSSEVLILALSNGKEVEGKYQRWDRDMNAPHLKAKKGDGFFHDLDDVLLKNVTAWRIK